MSLRSAARPIGSQALTISTTFNLNKQLTFQISSRPLLSPHCRVYHTCFYRTNSLISSQHFKFPMKKAGWEITILDNSKNPLLMVFDLKQ